MAEPDDFKLIREVVAAGGSKYTSGNVDRSNVSVWWYWVRECILYQYQRCPLSSD